MEFDINDESLMFPVIVLIIVGIAVLLFSVLQDNSSERTLDDFPRVVDQDVVKEGKVEWVGGSNRYLALISQNEGVTVYGGLPTNLTERNVTVRAEGDMIKYKVTEAVASEFRETTRRGLNVTSYSILDNKTESSE